MKKILRFTLLGVLFACGSEPTHEPATPVAANTLFSLLPSSSTGIDFTNQLAADANFDVFRYRNYYNGGGVAIGDLNNDGLDDIYLTANTEGNRLFINKGNWQFDDATRKAGVAGRQAWSTGVSLADVNADGYLDIYVCNSGNIEGDDKRNELFVNNGDGTFKEQAADYGLADEGFSTHAAFFDYDADGDLDMYLLNNSFRPISSFGLRNIRHERDPIGGDKLFRNDNGRFTDVSEAAGIFGSVIGFGLGVTIGDVNKDNCLDIYVSNDFFERDYLYINNCDGTFTENLPSYMGHISQSSMGADMADINNDAYPDIFVTDMLPASERRLKTTTVNQSYDKYRQQLKNDYYHQVMRNNLHLNNANNTFSEIGQLAGVNASDWSWAALITDLNNDGYKDIYVSNGIYKDLTDQDYINFQYDEAYKNILKGAKPDFAEMVKDIPSTRLPNHTFANLGNLTYADSTAAWGLDLPSHSNGSAYGDLDNDGDLDLVVNNVNQPLFVYRNNTNALRANNYIAVALKGTGANTFALGAKVTVMAGNDTYYQELVPSRGFQSSVSYRLHFGVGSHTAINAVQVVWPDGTTQTLNNPQVNQLHTIAYAPDDQPAVPDNKLPAPLFSSLTDQAAINFRHQENDFVDFNRERLMAHMLSTQGPKLAVADVNGDGLDDFYIGGAKNQPGGLFIQQRDGAWEPSNTVLLEKDKIAEDLGALFFDANADGHPDLYVASGGSEYSPLAPGLQDRLYMNNGRGVFTKSNNALPMKFKSTACVRAADYDGDGDQDLFVGGRTVPFQYGMPESGYLLQNTGQGKFMDVSSIAAPELKQLGMITDAQWVDVDNDNQQDLVLVGEWMPITIFKNNRGVFTKDTTSNGLQQSGGLWNCLRQADLDGDGDVDLVAGNLGLNAKITAQPNQPAQLYVSDFDANGSIEQILCYYREGKSYPMHLKQDLEAQVVSIKKKFVKFNDYALKQIDEIFDPATINRALVLTAHTMANSWVENTGNGQFVLHQLPIEAQLAPIYSIVTQDINQDGHLDLLLGGNLHAVKPEIGKYDASYGHYLTGNGQGEFNAVPNAQSGLMIKGEVRDMRVVNNPQLGNIVLVARNNDWIEAVAIQ